MDGVGGGKDEEIAKACFVRAHAWTMMTQAAKFNS